MRVSVQTWSLAEFFFLPHSLPFCSVFRVSFSSLDWYGSCGWILFVCCILVCTSISKCQYNFQFSYDFRPFLSLALTAFVCMSLYPSVRDSQWALCISVLWNYIPFITSTLFFPFRYLFNLIWFHFLGCFFSTLTDRIEKPRYFHNTCLFLFRASRFSTMQFVRATVVLLNYLKLIKPRTWIDFFSPLSICFGFILCKGTAHGATIDFSRNHFEQSIRLQRKVKQTVDKEEPIDVAYRNGVSYAKFLMKTGIEAFSFKATIWSKARKNSFNFLIQLCVLK